MSKPRGEMARKQPFRLYKSRATLKGGIAIVEDIDEGLYYVGIRLTVENINNPPYGVFTYYDEQDALDQFYDMCD